MNGPGWTGIPWYAKPHVCVLPTLSEASSRSLEEVLVQTITLSLPALERDLSLEARSELAAVYLHRAGNADKLIRSRPRCVNQPVMSPLWVPNTGNR